MRLIGGWGDRPDSLRSCAERLRESLRMMPAQDDVYDPWSVWRQRDESNLDLVPIDVEDLDALAREILAVTERVNDGPMRTPGQHIELARRALGERPETTKSVFKYRVRAGFVEQPAPYNHVLLELDATTDESLLSRYLGALVAAWEPDELAAVTRETQRAQGRKPPEAIIGWMTYVANSFTVDTGTLGDLVSVSAREGGYFITVPGTPSEPSLEHIAQVRQALGYCGS